MYVCEGSIFFKKKIKTLSRILPKYNRLFSNVNEDT